MQGISVLGMVASTLAAAKPLSLREVPIFESVSRPPQPIWRSLLTSVALHALVIVMLPSMATLLPESEEEIWERHARTFRPLEIQIPDRLYLASSPVPPPPLPVKKPKLERKPVEQQPAKLAKAAPAALPKAELDRVLPKQFRLPKVTRRPDAELTLIQPHLPPELQLTAQANLPNLFLSAPSLPRPAAKKFVEPGPSSRTIVLPKVEGPPQLAGAGSYTSELYIPSMLAGPDQAAMRLPKPTIQGRQFNAPAPRVLGHGSSVSPIEGEPISVLAMSTNPRQLRDQISIPLGNQIGRLAPPPPSADSTRGRPGIPGAKSGGTGNVASLSAGAGGNGTAVTGGNGPGGTGSAAGGSATGGGAAFANGNGLAAAIRYTTPIRIEHPSNAQFDVVVMQSSADEGFPESAGVLTGQPVYTVYLQVGAPRAWILQYCVPKETAQNPKQVGSTVYIGQANPVKAPFPLVTVLPPVTTLPRHSYVMVHGFVDKAGQFKDLTVLRAPGDQFKELLMPSFREWVFRPATRDGVPVLVEVLLAIPPHES